MLNIIEERLRPSQRMFLDFDLNTSIVVDGLPLSGKTTLALYTVKRLHSQGLSSIFIAPSSLSLKYLARLSKLLGINDFQCDTLQHYLNWDSSREYDYVVLDDSHLYSLTQLEQLKHKGKYFLLFGNYSHPCTDYYYLGSDRLSDQELPPLRGVLDCFDSRLFRLEIPLQKVYSQLMPWYKPELMHWSGYDIDVMRIAPLVRVIKTESLREQCLYIKKRIEESESPTCIAAYTRKQVFEALDIFRELGMDISAYLPGRDGVDLVNIESGYPLLTTIKSLVGLHFEDAYFLSFDSSVVKYNNVELYEIAITRAAYRVAFFYVKSIAEPIASLPNELFSFRDTTEKTSSMLF
ncbi:MAG: hypothetical protein J6N46_04685 [Bacteroidales bacterium]|nr:hypothetical protein [Bacteroidales bacterium]